jgi:hypothetical protein
MRISTGRLTRSELPIGLAAPPVSAGWSQSSNRRPPAQEHSDPFGMKKILLHEFAAFAQPGALIATFLVLLMMGAGGAAIAIAARGWPF